LGKSEWSLKRELNRIVEHYRVEVPVEIAGYRIAIDMDRHAGNLVPVVRLVRGNDYFFPHQVGRGIIWQFAMLAEAMSGRSYFEHLEHYLHPRAAADLAEAIIRCTDFSVFETHAESILLRLQRLVRDGQMQPAGVNIIVFEKSEDPDDPAPCKLRRHAMDEEGNLVLPFPDGFAEIYWDERSDE
jgi:hypothetical protein